LRKNSKLPESFNHRHMKSTIQVITSGLTGQYSGNVSLQLFYAPYLASYLIVTQIVVYNAFMSYQFYGELLGRVFNTDRPYLALIITTSIATKLYFGLSAIAGAYLQRKHIATHRKGSYQVLLHSLTVVVLLILALDIYANWQGRKPVAEATTLEAVSPKQDSVYQAIQHKIDLKQAKLDSLLQGQYGGYGWFEGRRFQLNWSGKELERTFNQDIGAMRQQQTLLTTHEIENGQQRQGNREQDIQTKTQAHSILVLLAYPLAILLSIFRRYYYQKARNYLRQQALHSQLAEVTEKTAPQKGYQITCAHCGKKTRMRSAKAIYCSDSCRSAAHKRKKRIENIVAA